MIYISRSCRYITVEVRSTITERQTCSACAYNNINNNSTKAANNVYMNESKNAKRLRKKVITNNNEQ